MGLYAESEDVDGNGEGDGVGVGEQGEGGLVGAGGENKALQTVFGFESWKQAIKFFIKAEELIRIHDVGRIHHFLFCRYNNLG